MAEPPTFTCIDCGIAVYDALGHVRERCWPCQWVANIPEENERKQVRAWLVELKVIDAEASS